LPTSSKQLPTLALVLHAHLPLVRHPELESSLEEAWLFEALVECYLPLLALTTRLQQRRSTVRFTLVLSPTLVSMLRDKYLQGRFYDYLDQLQALCRRVLRRQRLTPRQRRLLGWHLRRLRLARRRFSAIDGDLAGAWSRLAAGGRVELMTTAITHAYLPLCQASVVRAQLAAGREMHRLVFGSLPAGVWLPECGLDDHVMDILHRLGVGHTVAESHGLLLGVPRPPCGVFAPIRPFAELAVFGRDPAVSRQVWSTRKGYPGHGEYLEFHRDLAGEIAPDLLGSFALPGGDHRPTGIRLRRITGCTEQKRLYRPEQARLVAAGHARHFVGLCRRRLARLQSLLPSPVIVAPYDAELFGHWWHEGPLFLEQAFMEGEHQGAFRFDTLAGYLERWPPHFHSRPSPSSWGQGGYHHTWLNENNDWLLPRLRDAADRVRRAAGVAGIHTRQRRLLRQAACELALAQSSDWAFMLNSSSSAAYARQRLEDHLTAVTKLCLQVEGRQRRRGNLLDQRKAQWGFMPAAVADLFLQELTERTYRPEPAAATTATERCRENP